MITMVVTELAPARISFETRKLQHQMPFDTLYSKKELEHNLTEMRKHTQEVEPIDRVPIVAIIDDLLMNLSNRTIEESNVSFERFLSVLHCDLPEDTQADPYDGLFD